MKLFKFSKLKKFSSYFIELIIVVLGVSIAFQLNVWKDSSKERDVERKLIENFKAENNYNIRESDSSSINKQNTIKIGLRFIDILRQPMAPIDSARYYMAQLFEISWPNLATTHLDNYLNYTTGSTPLREEMLNLKSLTGSIEVLGEKYAELKQEKYFDYLSDAVDMNENLAIVNRDKIFSVQLRNNLMYIIAYEQSIVEVLGEIEQSQMRLDSLIKIRNN